MTDVHRHFCHHHWHAKDDRPAGASDAISRRDWIAVFGAVLGAFMAVLDIQVTNASLQYIQGGLAASLDEGSWISTSYLIAEIVVIPLTSWLAEVFSTRLYLLASCIGFLVFSIACGIATSLPEMIVFRMGQGFTAGALIPMALATVTTRLPPKKRAIGLALFGFTATFAPALGPALGGWLTITYSWRAIFYVNIVPGLVLIWSVWYAYDREPARPERLWHGDWLGIVTMAVGLACLIAVLEEGERKDWFTTGWIRYASIVAAIAIPFAILHELTTERPFLDLSLLRNRALGPAALIGLALGVGLYGTVYIIPVYLAQIQGYDALQIGEVVMWLGMPQLFILPFVPWLMARVDTRYLVGLGLALFALSNFMNIHMNHDTGLVELRLPQLVRAMGQPFVIVPLSALATGTLPRERQGQASALFNVMRNLGGSIGISMLSTFVTVREQFHFAVISQAVASGRPPVESGIAAIARHFAQPFGAVVGRLQALETIRNLVRRDAFVMAYSDCFFIMGVALVASIALLWLIPAPRRD